jgi:hypothetical protein
LSRADRARRRPADRGLKGASSAHVFDSGRGRDAHLSGSVAKQLMAKAPQLFVKQPEIQRLDVIADKLPQ